MLSKIFPTILLFLKSKKQETRLVDCVSFKLLTIEDICKKTLALDASKSNQNDSMPTKIIKNNSDIFSKFFQANLNNAIETSTFPEQLKYADVKPVFKKIPELTRKAIDQSVFFLMYLKFMKGTSANN